MTVDGKLHVAVGHSDFDDAPVIDDCRAFAWRSDGGMLAAVDDRTFDVVLLEPRGTEAGTFKAGGEITALDWHPDGERLACSLFEDISEFECRRVPTGELLWEASSPRVRGSEYEIQAYERPEVLAWSPDGTKLAASTHHRTILVLDADDGALLAHLVGHDGEVTDFAWSTDGDVLISASADRTLRVWDMRKIARRRPQPEFVVEGHNSGIRACAFTADGRAVVSIDDRGRVYVWAVAGFARVAEGAVDCTQVYSATFHSPTGRLAVRRAAAPAIDVLRLDVGANPGPMLPSARYVNATVVLVGDSGVGKSGLALALTGQPFVATESTHGRHIWVLHSEECVVDGVTEIREVFLWDLAGQPGYRLTHQLHLGHAEVALVVFDARSEVDPFSGARYWTRALLQAEQREGRDRATTCNLLVAGRIDRGGTSATQARIKQVAAEGGFAAFIATSAKTGAGIALLRDTVQRAIPWDHLTRVVSSKLLLMVKQFLVGEKEAGRVLSTPEDLMASFARETVAWDVSGARTGAELLRSAAADAPADEPPLALFETCIGRLESQALVRRLSFGGLVLLQPELLDTYAARIVNAARIEPDGLGVCAEAGVAAVVHAGDEASALSQGQRDLLAIATVEELLRRELALREHTESGSQLVFPSELTRDWPEAPELPQASVVYRFGGAVAVVYATLVVRLSRSGRFSVVDMWRTAVQLKALDGQTLGLTLAASDGEGEVGLFFSEGAGDEMKVSIDRYVETHLSRRAILGSVIRIERHVCPARDCGVLLSDDQVTACRTRGKQHALCPVCETSVSLLGLRDRQGTSAPHVVHAMNVSADDERMRDVNAIVLDGKSVAGEFDVFLCHNSEDKDEVKAVGRALQERYGLRAWLDDWQLRPGLPWQPALEAEIERIRSVAVFVGRGGLGPWQRQEIDAVLREFVQRQAPVIPVLLASARDEPELPVFLRGFKWVDYRRPEPVPLDQLVWGITGTPPEHHRR